jgi:2-phospho-L-lactate/phosphoenolpyruvate guanylyltransferase
MSCWAIIPVKGTPEGKSRMAGALDKGEREWLIRAMLAHVIHAAAKAGNIDCIALVGPERHGLSDTLALLDDPGTGLNDAVRSAFAEAERQGATRVVFLAGDLPQLLAREVDLLVPVSPDVVAIAPDRHGTGTNALSLPLPAANSFAFAFGPGSFDRHCAEAERLGLIAQVVRSTGLARDVDVPQDLPDAEDLLETTR